MRALFSIAISVCLACASVAPAFAAEAGGTPGFPSFQYHRIGNIGTQLGQTALVDVDRDGDLDWICGQAKRAGGEVWWWEYRGPADWVRHLAGKGNTDVGGAPADLNGDGWMDILAGSVLLLNPGDPRNEAFAPVETNAIYSHDTAFADIDGDGRPDALANSDESGLFWFEIPENPREEWTRHTIALAEDHEIHGGASPNAAGDLDGDGDTDAVTGEAWYENADGKGLEWIQHKTLDFGEHHRYGLAVKTWVVDMDGDGDLDFVQAEADNPDGRVAWFENDGEAHWSRHIIKDKGDKQDFHSLAVADFDGDGDWDVFSGGGPLSEPDTYLNFIWENTAGAGNNPGSEGWREHLIARQPCHEAVAADVDGDGDIDICSKPWRTGDEHYYLENRLVSR